MLKNMRKAPLLVELGSKDAGKPPPLQLRLNYGLTTPQGVPLGTQH